MSKVALWIRAARPFSFTGALVPVFLGTIAAAQGGHFHLVYFVVTSLAVLCLQAGVNLKSDYDDFANKVDVEGSYGSSGVILGGLLTPKEVRLGGLVLIGAGAVLGLLLAVERGWVVLALGLAGTLIGYSYTSRPFHLKYRGLGVPAVFLVYGPLLALGAFFIQAQRLALAPLLYSIPVGLLTTAILHANDIRDMSFDRSAGIATFSILAGRRAANLLYDGLLLGAYLALPIMVAAGALPLWCLASWATFPLALAAMKKLAGPEDSVEKILGLDQETGKLNSLFSALLLAALIFSFFVPWSVAL